MTFLLPEVIRRLYKTFRYKSAPVVDNPLRIGLISAATIAPFALCIPVQQLGTAIVVAVAARSKERAQQFADKWNIPNVFDTYDDIINSDIVDAVYIPLPNGLHFEWAKKALEAGKHVLLEKPSVSNEAQAIELANIARQYPHLILLEAFHYRFHPASLAFHALVNSNKYGILRRVEANFCAPDFFPAGDIRFNLELAGGGAMDMGAYTMNGLRWLLNSEPNRVIESKATELPNKPGIDKTLDVKFEFPALDGQGEPRIGHASLGWNMKFTSWIPCFIAETDSHILTYRNFLAPSVWHSLRVTDKKSGKLVEVKNDYGETGYLTYTYQLQAFVNKVKSNICNPISWRNIDDVPGNMRAIDMAYTAAGMDVRK